MARDPPRFLWLLPVSGLIPHGRKTDRLRLLMYDRFAESVIKAAKGEKGIVEPTFVYLPGVPGGDAIVKAAGVDFFSTQVELGVRSSAGQTSCSFNGRLC